MSAVLKTLNSTEPSRLLPILSACWQLTSGSFNRRGSNLSAISDYYFYYSAFKEGSQQKWSRCHGSGGNRYFPWTCRVYVALVGFTSLLGCPCWMAGPSGQGGPAPAGCWRSLPKVSNESTETAQGELQTAHARAERNHRQVLPGPLCWIWDTQDAAWQLVGSIFSSSEATSPCFHLRFQQHISTGVCQKERAGGYTARGRGQWTWCCLCGGTHLAVAGQCETSVSLNLRIFIRSLSAHFAVVTWVETPTSPPSQSPSWRMRDTVFYSSLGKTRRSERKVRRRELGVGGIVWVWSSLKGSGPRWRVLVLPSVGWTVACSEMTV